jgi:prepilin-type N-terminal cleavage/methylation domain-containing protein
MLARFGQTHHRKANAGFTLVEVVMSIVILALVMAGMIYGYVQTNQRAEWSSMSLAAQSLAAEAVEQARAAKWDVHIATADELPATTNYSRINAMLVPSTGLPTNVVTTVNVIPVYANPALRQIRADCVWIFPRTGNSFTNTVITYRAPDA